MLAVSILLITFFTLIDVSPQSTGREDTLINHTLNPIVVTAKRITTDIANSDTRIEVLDSSFIRNSNGTRLGDILKNSSSVFVRSYGHSLSLQTASTNGLGSSNTLFLYDGIRMNSFQNSGLDLALIPKNQIGSIEIIGNGASALYGSEAIGGVINILPASLTTGSNFDFTAGVSFGSFSTKNYSLAVGKRISSFTSRVFYTTTSSKGNYRYYFDNAGESTEKERENSGYNGYDVGLHLSFEPTTDLSVKLISSFTRQYKEIAGLETGTPPSISNQTDKNWNNILSLKKRISSIVKLNSFLNFQNNYSNYYLRPLPLSVYHNLVYSSGTNAELNFYRIKMLFAYDLTYASLRSNELDGFA
ncbi:MAG: TonB-dependent receptor, partial [Desulfobulbaceae bacterium]|nr:TonB-dependent receptor [Desulfobulbaceae bacterium]